MPSDLVVAIGSTPVDIHLENTAETARQAALARDLREQTLADIAAFTKGDKGDPGGDATQVGTFAQAANFNYAASIKRISTTGWAADGDGGAAAYTRWTAGMAALDAAGEGIWWFAAADGSRWQLADAPTYFTPMFGAMGDPALTLTTIAQNGVTGTDDAARINQALRAPMVKTLIVSRQHWFGSDIRKPSGKHLRGITRTTTGFHRIPLAAGVNQDRPRFGVYCEDDDSGSFADFFVNCQRSGWVPGLPADNQQHLLNRCSGLIVRRDSRNVRVSRVDVYNSWGYSHYTCAGDAGNAGPTPKGIIREDCRAYNGDTCFELTGKDASETLVNCWGYRDPIDGGNLVYMECAFHSYAGISRLDRIRCGFRGSAPAVLDSIADGLDSGLINNEECDFETSGGQAALIANNPDPTGVGNPNNAGKKLRDYRIIRCRLAAAPVFDNGAAPYSVLATAANVRIEGGEFSGVGIQAGQGARIDIRAGARVTAERPDGVGVFALGSDGDGEIHWYGKAGSVTAIHGTDPTLAKLASDFGVTFHDRPVDVSPAFPAVGGAASATYIQRVAGNKTAAQMTNEGYTVPPNYWFTLDLTQPVASRDKTEFAFSLQRDDSNTTGPEWAASIRWMSDGQVQVYVNSPGLAGCTLRYVVTEWA